MKSSIWCVLIFALWFLAPPALASWTQNIPTYRQNDPLWRDVQFDSSQTGQTIGSDGCALTCWAMIFSYHSKTLGLKDINGNDITYTPKQLNDLLIAKGAFITDANGKVLGIDMGKAVKAVEDDTAQRDKDKKGLRQVRFWAPGFSDGAGGTIPAIAGAGIQVDNYNWIKMMLDKKLPVEVRVDFVQVIGEQILRSPNGHSVLVTGYDSATQKYQIIDPMGEINYLDHTYYENRIYDFATIEMTRIPAPGAFLLGVVGVGLLGWLRKHRALGPRP